MLGSDGTSPTRHAHIPCSPCHACPARPRTPCPCHSAFPRDLVPDLDDAELTTAPRARALRTAGEPTCGWHLWLAVAPRNPAPCAYGVKADRATALCGSCCSCLRVSLHGRRLAAAQRGSYRRTSSPSGPHLAVQRICPGLLPRAAAHFSRASAPSLPLRRCSTGHASSSQLAA